MISVRAYGTTAVKSADLNVKCQLLRVLCIMTTTVVVLLLYCCCSLIMSVIWYSVFQFSFALPCLNEKAVEESPVEGAGTARVPSTDTRFVRVRSSILKPQPLPRGYSVPSVDLSLLCVHFLFVFIKFLCFSFSRARPAQIETFVCSSAMWR